MGGCSITCLSHSHPASEQSLAYHVEHRKTCTHKKEGKGGRDKEEVMRHGNEVEESRREMKRIVL